MGVPWDPQSEGNPAPALQRGTPGRACFLGKYGAAPGEGVRLAIT